MNKKTNETRLVNQLKVRLNNNQLSKLTMLRLEEEKSLSDVMRRLIIEATVEDGTKLRVKVEDGTKLSDENESLEVTLDNGTVIQLGGERLLIWNKITERSQQKCKQAKYDSTFFIDLDRYNYVLST